ncbi:MAG: ABC transporter permease subunit [Clostridia bacterium]|nr:ABC transporter permease subunit [Clostridia bacterium]
MKRFKIEKNFIFSLLAVVFLWLFWLIAYFIVRNDYLLPSVGDTLAETWRLLGTGEFWRAFGGTLLRTLAAFALSLVLGTGLSIIARLFTGVRAFFTPVISVLRSLPTVAIILILLLWTSPAVAPVIVSMLVLLPAVYAAVLAALDEVHGEYGELIRAFRVSNRRAVIKLYLPLAAPPVLGQAGGIFSLGLKITVSGEVLASTYRSLGGLMQEAKMYVQMPALLALTLVTVLTGFLLEGLCRLAYRLLVRWRP